MATYLKDVQIGAEHIKQAVFDLAREKQRQRDIQREIIHRALIIALHTASHWEKFKGR